jgi:enhancer of polycomb-like protein
LEDLRAQKEREIAREIATKKMQHQKWNENYVDWTNAPLTPPLTGTFNSGFRAAMTEYLPTPPASNSQGSDEAGDVTNANNYFERETSVAVRYTSLESESPTRNQPSFRRRIGRGGRLVIDRRGATVRNREELDPKILERFKFDDDDDDDLRDFDSYWVDQFDLNNMRYRAAITGNATPHHQLQTMRRQQQIEQAIAANSASSAGPVHGVNPPKETVASA